MTDEDIANGLDPLCFICGVRISETPSGKQNDWTVSVDGEQPHEDDPEIGIAWDGFTCCAVACDECSMQETRIVRMLLVRALASATTLDDCFSAATPRKA